MNSKEDAGSKKYISYEAYRKKLSYTISRINFLKNHLVNSTSYEKHALEDTLSEVIHRVYFSKLSHLNKQELFEVIEPCYDLVVKKLYNDLEINLVQNTLSTFKLQYNTKI